MSMGGFFTAYTPYQAEASQGMLAAIFEFQTMMIRLTGLDVSNASLYDGATAAVEACVMAINQSKDRSKILLASTLSQNIVDVIRMNFKHTPFILETVDCSDPKKTLINLQIKLDADCAGFLAQTPDCFGFVPDFTGFSDALKSNGTAFILSADPLSLAIFKTPAEWGADIAVGDVQAFGLDMNFGGPSAGYMAAGNNFLRQMPGRIVGQTKDRNGKRAFVLTLQAREQHIKRERATSNICSNQSLCAVGASVYLSLLGPEGLCTVAARCLSRLELVRKKLSSIPALSPVNDGTFFHDISYFLPEGGARKLAALADKGILCGLVTPCCGKDVLTIGVTETHTPLMIEALASALKEAFNA
jgi:glycine dehydrogenase subunit 1